MGQTNKCHTVGSWTMKHALQKCSAQVLAQSKAGLIVTAVLGKSH